MAQQSPEGRYRGASEEEAYEEKDEVEALHLRHVFDQTAKIEGAEASGSRSRSRSRSRSSDGRSLATTQLENRLRVASKMCNGEFDLQN